MLKKYPGLALALLFILCEAQGLDENELRNQLEELKSTLDAASKATGLEAAKRLDNIEREFENKCPDVFDSVKGKFGNERENVVNLHKQINGEIDNVKYALENLDKELYDERSFPEYKKKIEKLLAVSDEALNEIDELIKILKTCSASKPAERTVPHTASTANIALAPVTLTTAAAFMAIKLAFH